MKADVENLTDVEHIEISPHVEASGQVPIDYGSMAEEWVDGLFQWREQADPNDYLAVVRENRPSRLRLSSAQTAIENIMVRSTNDIDDGKIGQVAAKQNITRQTIRLANAFYRRGNYVQRRGEFFDAMAAKGIDDSIPELYVRLAEIINIIPEASLRQQGFSKLCRAIGGFAFLALLEQDQDKRDINGISVALRAGYDFAITYPLVDDLVHDSDYLESATEGRPHTDHNEIIEQMLTTGTTDGLNIPDNSITREIIKAYDEVLQFFPFKENYQLYRAVLALHHAQLADGQKSEIGEPSHYTKGDLVPYVVKAAMTRIIPLIVAKGGSRGINVNQLQRVVGLGLRTQLHDDLMDLDEDLVNGVHTPFSPYLVNSQGVGDFNPAELFIDSLFYSIERDFDSAKRRRVAQVLLGTARHAFDKPVPAGSGEELLDTLGVSEAYQKVIHQITRRYRSAKIEGGFQAKLDNLALNRTRLCKKLDVYLFDVQERMSHSLSDFIENSSAQFRPMYDYALKAYAKRVRPALVYISGDTFSKPRERFDDFALAAELLHTASLIIDDLPAQDNADLRRGKRTLHAEFGEDKAQLTALAMIFDAQNLIAKVDSDNNLGGQLTDYINESLGQNGLCLGQLEDSALARSASKDKDTVCADLDEVAYLKTGLAIELSIVGGAMIAHQPKEVIDSLKAYALHAGIVFQIKDDILDTAEHTGKTISADRNNDRPNYVEVLGVQGAKEKLERHIALARESLNSITSGISTRKYKELLDYIAEREH